MEPITEQQPQKPTFKNLVMKFPLSFALSHSLASAITIVAISYIDSQWLSGGLAVVSTFGFLTIWYKNAMLWYLNPVAEEEDSEY